MYRSLVSNKFCARAASRLTYVPRRFLRVDKVLHRDGKEKRFSLGWHHMQEQKPRTQQEKWHRAISIPSRVLNYDLLNSLALKTNGDRDTKEWRLFYETTKLGDETSDLKNISPWHDIPLAFKNDKEELIFNYVNEIPKGERAKMECSLNDAWNPLKQDIKKGKLRYFTYGDLPFNYGFLPQTWECPETKNEMTGLGGDNDPIDVVELSPESISMGEVTNLKVISVVGMIDEGETDWKVIGINTQHPLAAQLNSVEDIDKYLPGVRDTIIDWFRMYKTTDGKPENSFYNDGEFLGPDETLEVIKECHFNWMNLLLGRQGEKKKYSLESVHYKMLLAQKITSRAEAPYMGVFQILDEEEKFPSKSDLERIENDPKFK